MINFLSNNLIVLFYPIGSGGKFLINCLGLSPSALLQDKHFAQLQLDGQLTTQNKLDLLLSRLDQSQAAGKWNDLDMGDYDLYGTYLTHQNCDQYDPITHTVANSRFQFFAGSHEYNTLFFMSQSWPNAKIVEFVNENAFLEWMRPGWVAKTDQRKNTRLPDHLAASWQAVRGEQWPESPPVTVAQYQALPAHIRDEDQTLHQGAIQHIVESNQTVLDHLAQYKNIQWDCAWYTDVDAVIDHVRALYQVFDLTDFDADATKIYYHKWISCLQHLRSINQLNGLKPFYK